MWGTGRCVPRSKFWQRKGSDHGHDDSLPRRRTPRGRRALDLQSLSHHRTVAVRIDDAAGRCHAHDTGTVAGGAGRLVLSVVVHAWRRHGGHFGDDHNGHHVVFPAQIRQAASVGVCHQLRTVHARGTVHHRCYFWRRLCGAVDFPLSTASAGHGVVVATGIGVVHVGLSADRGRLTDFLHGCSGRHHQGAWQFGAGVRAALVVWRNHQPRSPQSRGGQHQYGHCQYLGHSGGGGGVGDELGEYLFSRDHAGRGVDQDADLLVRAYVHQCRDLHGGDRYL